jgi:hypothetical protein
MSTRRLAISMTNSAYSRFRKIVPHGAEAARPRPGCAGTFASRYPGRAEPVGSPGRGGSTAPPPHWPGSQDGSAHRAHDGIPRGVLLRQPQHQVPGRLIGRRAARPARAGPLAVIRRRCQASSVPGVTSGPPRTAVAAAGQYHHDSRGRPSPPGPGHLAAEDHLMPQDHNLRVLGRISASLDASPRPWTPGRDPAGLASRTRGP